MARSAWEINRVVYFFSNGKAYKVYGKQTCSTYTRNYRELPLMATAGGVVPATDEEIGEARRIGRPVYIFVDSAEIPEESKEQLEAQTL